MILSSISQLFLLSTTVSVSREHFISAFSSNRGIDSSISSRSSASGSTFSFKVGNAGSKGLGLFTLTDIPANHDIGLEYEGEILNVNQYRRRYPSGHSRYAFQLNEGQRRDLLYCDAVNPSKSNLTRFINHGGDESNLEVFIFEEERIKNEGLTNRRKKDICYHVRFITTRFIHTDEELLFDYGPKFNIFD